jgi:threonylcarbamoyladenosine tRNA methylthiotransferase MtaB
MFLNTKKLPQEAGITLLHAFPFSARPGTPAASMPQVDPKTISSRVKDFSQISENVLSQKLEEYPGKSVKILAETEETGKTDSFLPVRSLKRLVIGNTYIFRCLSCEKKYIIGEPTAEF